MSNSNRNNVDRLPFKLRLDVADHLLNGVSYAQVRERLAVAGLAVDDLPSDRSLRAYQQGVEYMNYLDQALADERRRRAAALADEGKGGNGAGGHGDTTPEAPNTSQVSKSKTGSAGAAGAAGAAAVWREPGAEAMIEARAVLLAHLHSSLGRSDTLMIEADRVIEQADRSEEQMLAALDAVEGDENDAMYDVLDADYEAARRAQRNPAGEGVTPATTASPASSRTASDETANETRDDGEMVDATEHRDNCDALEAALREKFADRVVQAARERRKRHLETLMRRAETHARSRDRVLRHPGLLRTGVTLRMMVLLLRLVEEQMAAVAAARATGLRFSWDRPAVAASPTPPSAPICQTRAERDGLLRLVTPSPATAPVIAVPPPTPINAVPVVNAPSAVGKTGSTVASVATDRAESGGLLRIVTPERAALPAASAAPIAPVAAPVAVPGVAKPQSKLAETLTLLETKVVPPETRQMLIAMASTIDDLRLISDLGNATDSEDFVARLAAGAALGPDGQPIPPPEGLIFDGSLDLNRYSDEEMPELFGHLKAAAATGMLRLNLPF